MYLNTKKLKFIEEICPYCDNVIQLPSYLGIYKCTECKKLMITCSMCENQDCNNCDYCKLTENL